MIQSIHLKNFQSHENSLFNFHPGVNSIIGSSNSGKTSVLRGLFWALNNRPSGQAFISHWNQDKKGSPIENTEVTITLENDNISRGRGKDFNGYQINGKTLEAIGTDVPEEVIQAFNLGEVNIQKQMDAPFLLSESAGGVARFFNREIRLDLIDRILSSAESLRRLTLQNIHSTESELEKLENDLAELDWLPIAEKILSKAEKVNDGIEQGRQKVAVLTDAITAFKNYLLIIDECESVLSAQSLISTIEKQIVQIDQDKKRIDNLDHYIQSYKKQLEIKDKIPNLKESEVLLNDLIDLQSSLTRQEESAASLAHSIQSYQRSNKEITVSNSAIETYTQQLPDTCPLCGGAI